MLKEVKYFKLRNDAQNQDSIIKITTIEAEESITLELNFVLYKSGNEYKKYLQSGTNLILALEASFINNKIQLKGGSGRIFEIMDFHISPNELFEFKSLGLFSYFTSYILRELIDKYNINSNINVVFTGGPQVEKDKEDLDTYNRMNFTRKLKTYRKLGFKLKKVCKNKYHLQDTPVSKIKNIALPNSIKFYEYALELINDAKEIIPFANEKVKPLINYALYDFADKETLTLDVTIDVTKIIGTSHPKYNKKTWIDAINSLRTASYVEDLKLFSDSFGSIDFYRTIKNYERGTDPWGIKIINGKHYISEGNHRTIIAKFLNALDLIEDKVKGPRYIKQFEVNNKDKIKYHSILRWLRIYYPKYSHNLSLRNKEVKRNKINEYTEDIYYEREYDIFTHYSSEDGELINNYICFKDIEALRNYIKNDLNKNRILHNINYRINKIFNLFRKTKAEEF
jgi:hypothetical protein